eukprot:CAMPEP_0203668870 /NCGR_PEP_ID=MMETSP0090-20130426/5394_1 /ASSEMBLY_ACC=CAM_ASM_001088 /TAXON_ID=426623 /ORGANISM="Chaetoceros affinis, Strain CCMP159" /LENGTH=216 /DNA_ID=CAMNT_0050533425 /DNA_START=61 /DNA_END=711 /DNA_ORIENTATION=-
MRGLSSSKAIFVFLLASVNGVKAFSACSSRTAAAATTTTSLFSTNQNNDNANSNELSRQDFFQTMIKSSAVATATAFMTLSSSPLPANADVTSKIASQASLRYIKRSIKELEKLEFVASNNDYSEMKQGLRSPALSEIRKNAKVLIKGGEDGAEAENLVASYDAFIKDIEKLDGDASLGFRGRKGMELYPSYAQTMKDLRAFTEVAERSTSIPVTN